MSTDQRGSWSIYAPNPGVCFSRVVTAWRLERLKIKRGKNTGLRIILRTNTRAAAAAVSGVVGRTLRVRKYVSRAGAACRAGRRIS